MSNVDVVKSIYDAFAKGDIESVFALIDPNVEWIESDDVPYGGRFVGHEAIQRGVFAKIGKEWDNFVARVDEFIDAGDTVVALGVDSGTYKSTGKCMQAPTASIWTFRNGKLKKFRQYIDTLAVVDAMK